MSNIATYGGGSYLTPRDARRVERSRSNAAQSRQIGGDQVDLETDVAIDKIQNTTLATGTGMQAVSNVASAQQAFELLVPGASARLAMVADGHALDVVDILADLRRRVRRI